METLGFLADGFAVALRPENLMWSLVGVTVGTAVGVLPGIGPALTIALLLPLTYQVDVASAFMLFAGIYYGAMYGGSTTSILLNTPGEKLLAGAAGDVDPQRVRVKVALPPSSRRRRRRRRRRWSAADHGDDNESREQPPARQDQDHVRPPPRRHATSRGRRSLNHFVFQPIRRVVDCPTVLERAEERPTFLAIHRSKESILCGEQESLARATRVDCVSSSRPAQ